MEDLTQVRAEAHNGGRQLAHIGMCHDAFSNSYKGWWMMVSTRWPRGRTRVALRLSQAALHDHIPLPDHGHTWVKERGELPGQDAPAQHTLSLKPHRQRGSLISRCTTNPAKQAASCSEQVVHPSMERAVGAPTHGCTRDAGLPFLRCLTTAD